MRLGHQQRRDSACSIWKHLEDNGDTLLTGPVVDQAALHGLLKKVRDVGMPLISVNRGKPVKQTFQTSTEPH